ncbi:MAG: VOC family protein [Bacteroidota bacterium]|nr:VOC family protein [Bacteroidota bacterium]
MIFKLSHSIVYVLDQEEAMNFYINKLGLELRNDSEVEGFRWLTVGAKGQQDLEIVLMPILAGLMYNGEVADHFRELIKKGIISGGVFKTNDCKNTYEELKSKGVEFTSAPQKRPYGIEAVFKDNSGNWFSLVQEN